MHHIAIRPVWTIQGPQGQTISPRLIELLTQVHTSGSLQAACKSLGMSYRHGWTLIRDSETAFRTPLLQMTRGKGSELTPLASRLMWADQRIAARLEPVLDTLASELQAEIGQLLPAQEGNPRLRLHASHGYAIEKLVMALQSQGHAVERRYVQSVEAVAALQEGACEVCGFHIPLGAMQADALAHHMPWLAGDEWRVMDVANRRQGLMVPAGNPHKVYELRDLTRPGVRFVNRPPGSATRWLLEGLLRTEALNEDAISGFERCEATHAAVAAAIGSDLGNAGFGLEAAARQFKLDFIPLVVERYFLVCHVRTLHTPAMAQVLALLQSAAFRASVDALPGYEASHMGRITPWTQAFN